MKYLTKINLRKKTLQMSALSRMASQQNYDKQLSVDSKSTDEVYCYDSDADKEYKPHTEKIISKYR